MSACQIGPVAVVGAGGHGKMVVATLQAAGLAIAGVFDDDATKHGTFLLGVQVEGTLTKLIHSDCQYAVIGVGDNRTRMQLVERLQNHKMEWISVVHPLAYVHPSAKLGKGTVVFAGAIIQPDAVVGSHSIINTGATVDHDCQVDDFVHLAPGTNLAGKVRIHAGAFIGIGTAIIPGLCVGEWAVVGAGAAVIRDVPAGAIEVGVPAKGLSPRSS
jgi:sugar O-acyltransferase (sialic acid O-acetyltransferase NeuD family)